MTLPVLYGMSGSWAFRSVWAMKDSGVDYEHVPTHFLQEAKADEFMDLTPNCRIPCLVDGRLDILVR